MFRKSFSQFFVAPVPAWAVTWLASQHAKPAFLLTATVVAFPNLRSLATFGRVLRKAE